MLFYFLDLCQAKDSVRCLDNLHTFASKYFRKNVWNFQHKFIFQTVFTINVSSSMIKTVLTLITESHFSVTTYELY